LRRFPPSIDDGAIAAASKIERATAALRGSSRPARSQTSKKERALLPTKGDGNTSARRPLARVVGQPAIPI
jgi:hypothetical protein